VNILPVQARAVLDGRKTQHRLLAHSRRSPVKRGQVVKLAPAFDARVQIRDVLWATAGKISGRDLKVEAFKNPVDLKRDFLWRYDAQWAERGQAAGDLNDEMILARFEQRWATRGVWLVTVTPAVNERYLRPGAGGDYTEGIASSRPAAATTITDPAAERRAWEDEALAAKRRARDIDPLDAGAVVDPTILRPEWAETSAARHRATQAGAKRDARLIAQRAEKAMLEHRLSGNSGPLEMLRRELDSLINDRREAA
jgi:hypothetical protein